MKLLWNKVSHAKVPPRKVSLTPKWLDHCIWGKTSFSTCHQQDFSKCVAIEESKQNKPGGPQCCYSSPPLIPNKKAGFLIRKDGSSERNETQTFRNKNSLMTSLFTGTRDAYFTSLHGRQALHGSEPSSLHAETPGRGAGGQEYNPRELIVGETPT